MQIKIIFLSKNLKNQRVTEYRVKTCMKKMPNNKEKEREKERERDRQRERESQS